MKRRAAIGNAISKRKEGVAEGLTPKQRTKIDKNKNGRIDEKDFEILRAKKGLKEAAEAPVMASAPGKRPTKNQNDNEVVSNEEKGADNRRLIKVFPELKIKESTYGKFLEMIQEKTLTDAETSKKEEIVKSMKKKTGDFEKRYPGRGKEVMYATATKMAKKVAEECGCEKGDKGEKDPRSMKTDAELIKNKLRSALGVKNPLVMVGESSARDAMAAVSAEMDPKSIIGTPEQKAATEKRKKSQKSKPKPKLKGYSIPGADAGGMFRKSYTD